jgi:hypothetical protein
MEKQRAQLMMLGCIFIVLCIVVFAPVVMGNQLMFAYGNLGFMTTMCFWFAGLGYWYVKSKTPRPLIGVIEIVAGLWSNYHQMTKIGMKLGDYDKYDRIVFIIAGIAVIGHGFQELIEGLQGQKKPGKSL